MVKVGVSDVSQVEPLADKFELEATPSSDKKKKRSDKQNPRRNPRSPTTSNTVASLAPPQPSPARKFDQATYGFDCPTDALPVESGEDGKGYDFYINIDNPFLINALSDKQSDEA